MAKQRYKHVAGKYQCPFCTPFKKGFTCDELEDHVEKEHPEQSPRVKGNDD